MGGGSLPGTTLPNAAVALETPATDDLLAKLRNANPTVITRIADGRVLLDPRTVLPEQDERLISILQEVLL